MIKGWIVGKDELIGRLSAMPGRLDQSLMKVMTGLGIELATFIKQNYLSGQSVKRISGTGSRSTVSLGAVQTADAVTVTVKTGGPEAPYMKWLNDGVPPYEIVPKNKKALAFTWQGKQMVLKRVHHPGQKGREFMQQGLAAFSPTIKSRLEEAIGETLK